MAEQNALAYRDGSTYQSSVGYANPVGFIEYSSAVSCAATGGVGAPFMRDRIPLVADARAPQALSTQSSAVSALDGKQAPLAGDSRWRVNSGRFSKTRFLTDIVVRGVTSVADDPALTLRGYVRSGGTSGAVGAGESTSYTRPRLSGDSRIYAAKSTEAAQYTVYSSVVIDGSTATGMNLIGLAANSSCFFIIGGPAPFCGMAFTQDTTAVNAADTTAVAYKYWNGASSVWTTLSNVTEGNKGSSKVFAASGQVSWDIPDGWTSQTLTSVNYSGYFVQGSVSTALASAAGQTAILVREVDLLFPIKVAIDVQVDGDDGLLALESISTGLTGTPAYSGSLWASMR